MLVVDGWMTWRKQRYGRYCLTAQEFRAVWYSAHYLVAFRGQGEHGVGKYVAGQMRISESWASRLLSRAEAVIEYLEFHGIEFAWTQGKHGWTLNAPVSVYPLNLPTIQLPRYIREARAA